MLGSNDHPFANLPGLGSLFGAMVLLSDQWGDIALDTFGA